MNHFDRRHLNYFVAVAEELHFGNAARRLHMSQPPLSQQIAALEADLGVPLLTRTKRKVEITPAGQLFLKDARTILADMDKAAARVKAAADGQIGTLRLGLNYSSPISPMLSAIFRCFAKCYPHVGLDLHENTSAKQLDGLYHQTLDACFIWPTRDDTSPDLTFNSLGKDELRLVCSRETPLGRAPRFTVSHLRDQTIFLTLRQTRIPFYDALISACHKAGFEPNIRTDMIQLPFIMNVAATGQGVAFVPEFFERIRPEGTLFRWCGFLPRAARMMPLSLAYRTKDPSPFVKNFVDAAKDTIR